MKRIVTIILLCGLCLMTLAAGAAEPAKAGKKGKGARKAKAAPIRVLLTVGGHGFDQKAFYAMMDSIPGIKYDTMTCPKDLDKLKPGLEKEYDVILMYDQMKNLTPEQQKNLIALIKDCGIGVFSLHHQIGANSGWDEWANVIGALYVRGPRVIDGVQYTKAVSKDDQEFKIHIADQDHPITKGLKDFEVTDEAYDKYYLNPRVHVIITTEHPLNAKSVAWVTSYGKSPVFYFQLGHDAKAYNHPSFREILKRGIEWTAAERRKMNK